MKTEQADVWGFMNIPTRLEVNVDSTQRCAAFDVFLDGVQQKQCLIADAEKGYIKRYKTNAFGFPIPSGIRKGHMKTEELYGVVTFVTKAEVMAKYEASRDIDAEILRSVEEMVNMNKSAEERMLDITGDWSKAIKKELSNG